jgi:DNA-directed RNA polymerase subunit RPC12/RpoP
MICAYCKAETKLLEENILSSDDDSVDMEIRECPVCGREFERHYNPDKVIEKRVFRS